MSLFFRFIYLIFLFKILSINSISYGIEETDFVKWLNSYKKNAIKKGISQETVDVAFKNVK